MKTQKVAVIRSIGFARSLLFSLFIIATNSFPLAAYEATGLKCVIPPYSVTTKNASTIEGITCSMKVGDAHLRGVLGSLSTYQVNNLRFQVFRPRFDSGCTRGNPCRERVSLNGQPFEWAVNESPVNLGFQCGRYYCRWETWRKLNGEFLFAVPFSI